MNLRQLRYVFETARQGFNISGAAAALHTSQPGVSKQVRLLEEELGVAVFVRQGKRLTGITEPGGEVLKIAERMLRDADNLRAIGREFGIEEAGTLAIATTHTQARYVLPPVIREFLRRHPAVRVHLHQGSPSEGKRKSPEHSHAAQTRNLPAMDLPRIGGIIIPAAFHGYKAYEGCPRQGQQDRRVH